MFASLVTNGADIPKMTHKELQWYFGIPGDSPLFSGMRDKSYDWIVPYLSDKFELVTQSIGDLRIHHSWVNRSLALVSAAKKWEAFVKGVGSSVNGQVKNFLVACRTAQPCVRKDITVLIRGSKSSSASGTWKWMFADYLAKRNGNVLMHAYDPCEVAGVAVREIVHGDVVNSVTIVSHPDYYKGDGKEFDIVIDDAYDVFSETGTVPWVPKSFAWSLKDHSSSAEPYLHMHEGRIFSHTVEGQRSPCPCVTCRTIASFTTTYSEFVQLKQWTIELGGSPCFDVPHSAELRHKATVYNAMCTQPSADVAAPKHARAAMMLMTDVGVKPVSPSQVALVDISSSDRLYVYQKHRGFNVPEEASVCPRLEGKNILFIGVDPSILGKTKVSHIPPVNAVVCRKADVAFLRGYGAATLWSLDDEVQGYDRTGYEFAYFREFAKKQAETPRVVHSAYSMITGLDLRLEKEIAWTQHIPGDYRVSEKQYDGLYTDYHPHRRFALTRPFSVDSNMCETSIVPGFANTIVENGLPSNKPLKLEGRGGIYYGSHDLRCLVEGNGASSCGHDHFLKKNGGEIVSYVNPNLFSVLIKEGEYVYSFRARRVDHESLTTHFKHYRGMIICEEKGQYLARVPI